MQVTVTNVDGLKHDFKIVVPAGRIEEMMTRRLEEVGREARLPGFRPGKIPMALLRKKYGPSVMGEVVQEAVNAGTNHAMAEKSLTPAVQPDVQITAFAEGKDLEFTVAVETLPAIEPIDFKSLSIERLKVAVPDEEVQKMMDNIAKSRGTAEAVSEARPAATGDVVVIDFEGKVDGVPFEGGKGEGYELELGSGEFIPGFEEQLVGVKAGETREVAVTFPAEYPSEALAGKAASFTVAAKELKVRVPAKQDDELAKAVGLDNLEAMKKQVREQIERNYAQVTRMRLKRVLLDALAERHSFPVPKGLVDPEFEAIWKQIEDDKKADRLDAADKGKSDDELKSEYRAIAERRVRLGLLLADVGRKNNISANQEDLNRALMNEVRRYPGQESAVFKYYRENPHALEHLKAPIIEDKVVDFIVEMAQVTDKSVTLDELMREAEQAGKGA